MAKQLRQIGKASNTQQTQDLPAMKAGELGDMATRYLMDLEVKNYSKESIKTKKSQFRVFIEWAVERDLRRPQVFTKPIIESYQRHLWRYRQSNGKRLSVTTQRGRLGALQNFFSWLARKDYILANPASDLEMPRKEIRLPEQSLSINEVKRVLNVPDVTDELGIRNRTILEVFYSTGIRRSELAKIDVSDLHEDRGTLQIRQGKGKKDRVVPIGKTALQWVARYLDHVRHLLVMDVNESALFLTVHGDRVTKEMLSRLVKKSIEEAEIGRSGSCHLLRHSCATHMLEGGADIRYIQQLLGHSKLDTTAIYTQVSIQQLREVHASCHPLEIGK